MRALPFFFTFHTGLNCALSTSDLIRLSLSPFTYFNANSTRLVFYCVAHLDLRRDVPFIAQFHEFATRAFNYFVNFHLFFWCNVQLRRFSLYLRDQKNSAQQKITSPLIFGPFLTISASHSLCSRPFTFFACKCLTVLLATGMTCAGAEKAVAAPKEPLVRPRHSSQHKTHPFYFIIFSSICVICVRCMLFYIYIFVLCGCWLGLQGGINPAAGGVYFDLAAVSPSVRAVAGTCARFDESVRRRTWEMVWLTLGGTLFACRLDMCRRQYPNDNCNRGTAGRSQWNSVNKNSVLCVNYSYAKI